MRASQAAAAASRLEKPTKRAEEFKAMFEVPYTPGALRAVGVSGGNETETLTLETAGPAVGVRLRPDWGDEHLQRTELREPG